MAGQSRNKPAWVQRVQRGEDLHQQIEEEVLQDKQKLQEFEAKVEAVAAKEDLRHNSEKSAERDEFTVKRRLQIYSDVFGGVSQTYPTPVRQVPDEYQPTTWEQWIIKDRRDNILHILWAHHYWTNHKKDLQQLEFNEVVIARALLRLLAYIPNAYGFLTPLYTEQDIESMPTHEDALRFIFKYMDTGIEVDDDRVDEGMLRSHTPSAPVPKSFTPVGAYDEEEQFLGRVFDEVPGMHRAVFKVLRRYREAVLFQRSLDKKHNNEGGKPIAGYLPYDDELGPEYEVVTWDTMISSFGLPEDYRIMELEEVAMQLAVSAVRAGMPVSKAYKQYEVSRDQLTQRCKDQGISLKRGKRAAVR